MIAIDELNRQLGSIVTVDSKQFEKLNWFINELIKWNRKINLTSITDVDECWEKHVVDSLLAACFIHNGDHVLDIGSGAGFPSIPLRIIYDQLRVDSVDSVNKKISFQRHCSRHLDLSGYTAHAKRVESLRDDMAGHFDVVVSRAFTSLDNFIDVSAPFIAPNGRIVAMKGSAAVSEIELAKPNLEKHGLVIERSREVDLGRSKSKRFLIEIKRQV